MKSKPATFKPRSNKIRTLAWVYSPDGKLWAVRGQCAKDGRTWAFRVWQVLVPKLISKGKKDWAK